MAQVVIDVGGFTIFLLLLLTMTCLVGCYMAALFAKHLIIESEATKLRREFAQYDYGRVREECASEEAETAPLAQCLKTRANGMQAFKNIL